ncbi:bifunctional phosphopantothenoylcysteine decarboxylase/phosphopantothenate--cysteine ligase CoaBC [Gemmobacter nectariphilus]|uniref:bifunctional phosphopantothenoylcysteine decarboxylase/phosphopantothenate--cysteine ligase CoaBC n=1 Tax=Gemmobacter nectariphilus TaxID=220343 RepID=UPI0004211C6B|nr:bifunctional phosphopantothenoylcysteine decarboxylase/phosphopantothenate--cysteine ligase CoaBC [Gemmobacter nectariphilus]
MIAGKRILLIIGGGIAAFKAVDLIRKLRERGASVVPVLTRAGAQFVTPLTVGALAGHKVHLDLFDLTEEAEMGHIQLSRAADLVVVVPATADLMAKMAGGHADDLASTLLMATDKPVMIAPAMNVRMWEHPATQRNLATLLADGVRVIGPIAGPMACGEFGPGRMVEPADILAAMETELADGPLAGRRILVTSGPTHEPIDPVRYIANRSSGAQGTALAAALRDLGAQVVFVTGPASVPPPQGVQVVRVETARQMLEAVQAALPVDAAVMAAAVADWRVANAAGSKMKKDGSGRAPALEFAENPDILATVSKHASARPGLVVGFAAETDTVIEHATAKRLRKGCDWIVANDVRPDTGIMGGSSNAVTIISDAGAESWPMMGKDEVARRLADRIAAALAAG